MHIETGYGDEDFDDIVLRYLQKRVDTIVHDYIKHSLKDVIERRLVQLRLTDPNCPAITEQVTTALHNAIAEETQRIVPNLVRNELGTVFSNISRRQT